MINTNENVGNDFLVSSSSALQSVFRGRVIITTLSLNTETKKPLPLQPLHSHRAANGGVQSDFKKSVYIEIAVLMY